MSGIGYAKNSSLYIDTFSPYFRLGEYIFDPSGKNANYLYKSLSREDMKKHLMRKDITKEEIVDMLLDFVDNGEEYQCTTA